MSKRKLYLTDVGNFVADIDVTDVGNFVADVTVTDVTVIKRFKRSTTLGDLCHNMLNLVLSYCDIQRRGDFMQVSKDFMRASAVALPVSTSMLPTHQLWVQLRIPHSLQLASGMPPKSLSIGRPLYGIHHPGPTKKIMDIMDPSRKAIPQGIQQALRAIPVLRMYLGDWYCFNLLEYPECRRLELKGMRVEARASAAQSFMYEEMTFLYCTIADINAIFEHCGSLRQVTCINSLLNWAPKPTLQVTGDRDHLVIIRK